MRISTAAYAAITLAALRRIRGKLYCPSLKVPYGESIVLVAFPVVDSVQPIKLVRLPEVTRETCGEDEKELERCVSRIFNRCGAVTWLACDIADGGTRGITLSQLPIPDYEKVSDYTAPMRQLYDLCTQILPKETRFLLL